MTRVLIVFDTRGGATLSLAERVAEGVKDVADTEVVFRRVAIPAREEFEKDHHGDSLYTQVGAIREVGPQDFMEADAVVTGCPSHFGGMTTGMQAMWEATRELWHEGTLSDKPGAVFTTVSGPRGGAEMTLLSLMTPMFHHGMLIVPPEQSRHDGESRVTPLGLVSYSSQDRGDLKMAMAMAYGRRIAGVTRRLAGREVLVETR